MSPDNIVRATFGRDEAGVDRYEGARAVLDAWLADGGVGPRRRAGHLSLPPDVHRGPRPRRRFSGRARPARDPPRVHRAGRGDRLCPGRGAAPRAHARGAQARPAEAAGGDGGGHRSPLHAGERCRAARFCARPSRAANPSRRPATCAASSTSSGASPMRPRWPACKRSWRRGRSSSRTATIATRRRWSTRGATRRRARSSWPSSPWRRRGSPSFPTIGWSTGCATSRWRGSSPGPASGSRSAPLDDPVRFRPTNRRLGVVSADQAAVFTLRDGAMERIAWPAGTSAAWRALAVSILHEGAAPTAPGHHRRDARREDPRRLHRRPG